MKEWTTEQEMKLANQSLILMNLSENHALYIVV